MTVPPSDATTTSADAAPRAGAARRLVGAARRHAGFLTLFALGALLRVAFMVGYQPAFWFHGDSGSYLVAVDRPLNPHPYRPLGYVLMLKAFEPTGDVLWVVAAQHLAGLALGLAVYLLLRRRTGSGWLACLAAAPVLFDATQLTLEHTILAETLFTVLLTGAALVLLWPEKPGAIAATAAGLLLAAAWFTRPNAMPAVVILGGYLLLRRVGWRPVLAYAVAFGLPFAGVTHWLGDRPNPYNGPTTAVALYSRAAMVADCDRLELPADQRAICPNLPAGQRFDRADAYVWSIGPEQVRQARDHDIGTATVSGFAYSVIRQQPGDLAWIISKETAAHFAPWMRLGPGHDCLRQRYRPPVTVHRDTPVFGKCTPDLFSTGFRPVVADARSAPEATPLTRALHGYGLLARSTPVLLSASVLLTLAVLLFRRRRPWPATRDALLLTVTSLGMVVPTAVLMYDARYALPTLPLLCVAVGLALHQLLPKRSGEDVEPATGQASDGGHPQP